MTAPRQARILESREHLALNTLDLFFFYQDHQPFEPDEELKTPEHASTRFVKELEVDQWSRATTGKPCPLQLTETFNDRYHERRPREGSKKGDERIESNTQGPLWGRLSVGQSQDHNDNCPIGPNQKCRATGGET